MEARCRDIGGAVVEARRRMRRPRCCGLRGHAGSDVCRGEQRGPEPRGDRLRRPLGPLGECRKLGDPSVGALGQLHGLRRWPTGQAPIIYRPPDLPADRPVPLIIALHGSGGVGTNMEGPVS